MNRTPVSAEITTEITIAGYASVASQPDTIRLRLALKGMEASYDRALRAVDQKTRQLQALVTEQGLPKAPVTDRLSIDEVWKHQYDDDKRQLLGFKADHILLLDLPLDMALLEQFLQALASTAINPTVRVMFEVGNPAAMMEQARTRALDSAKAAALTVARQMGLRLLGIRSINYSAPRNSPSTSLELNLPEQGLDSGASMELLLMPEDVTVQDSVSVVWVAAAEE